MSLKEITFNKIFDVTLKKEIFLFYVPQVSLLVLQKADCKKVAAWLQQSMPEWCTSELGKKECEAGPLKEMHWQDDTALTLQDSHCELVLRSLLLGATIDS